MGCEYFHVNNYFPFWFKQYFCLCNSKNIQLSGTYKMAKTIWMEALSLLSLFLYSALHSRFSNYWYSAFMIFQKFFFFPGALHRRSKFANFCHDLMQNL